MDAPISQFGVTICACADKGYWYQACEILVKLSDLKNWMGPHENYVITIHVCTSCISECTCEGSLFN